MGVKWNPENVCHTNSDTSASDDEDCIALVGHHNVEKSVIFHHPTGRYVTVANYPGTTVEIAKAKARELTVTVFDTAGIMTLPPQTAGEWMTARLLQQAPMIVLQTERSDLALETELGGMFKVSLTVQRDRGRNGREQ